MKTLVLDFETYFSSTYSLKKMPTLLYIRHPEFLIHGAAVKEDDTPARWIPRDRLSVFLAGVDWSNTTLISHNSNFDNTILYEKYGHSPARRVDTLALCRLLLPHDLDFDLGSICPLLGLGEKGDDLALTLGLRELTPEIEAKLGAYAIQDAELEYKLFGALHESVTEFQRRVMDSIIRMSTEGRLLFNGALAAEAKVEIDDDRRTKAEFIGLPVIKHPKTGKPWVPQLTSRDQFADLLRAKGVEPPTKLNKKKEVTYAFSKQDPDFVRLQADPEVAPLVAARMAWASNNAVTRIENLIQITDLAPHTLPVQLNVSGAHTHRASGGGGINTQNMNRGSKLRLAIEAPPGYVVLVVDASQIELRLNMALAGQKDVLEFLTPGEYVFGDAHIEWKGGDLYRREAAMQFGIAIEAVDKNQRQYGKICQLGMGYQMGHRRFRVFCATGPLGVKPIYLSEEQATQSIYNYRSRHGWVKASWDWFQYVAIPVLANGGKLERGPIVVQKDEIILPNGYVLQYPDTRGDAPEEGEEEDGSSWVWGVNGVKHHIYGGITDENVVQALAGIFINEKMLEVEDTFDGEVIPVHQVHDENIFLCPEKRADEALRIITTEIMSKSPSWMPDLPVRAEGGYAHNYSK